LTIEATYNHSTKALSLPSQISALRPDIWRSADFVDAVLSLDDLRIRMAILKYYHPYYFGMMSPVQVSEIIGAWELQADYDALAPMPGFRYFYLHYVEPPRDFATGTLREFIYMDEYLEEIVSGDASLPPAPKGESIACLTALLYRRPADHAAALRRDDRRAPLIGRDQVGMWAQTINRHSYLRQVQSMQASALLYAIGVKQLVHNLYGSRLFSGEANTSHNLGWMAVAMQVAEQGVFGNYEQVLDTTLHEVLAYMLVKKSEADAADRKE